MQRPKGAGIGGHQFQVHTAGTLGVPGEGLVGGVELAVGGTRSLRKRQRQQKEHHACRHAICESEHKLCPHALKEFIDFHVILILVCAVLPIAE